MTASPPPPRSGLLRGLARVAALDGSDESGSGPLFTVAYWRDLWGYLNRSKALLALLALLGTVQSLLFLPTLYLVRYSFDVAIPKAHTTALVLAGLGVLGLRLASSLLVLVTRSFSVRLAKAAIRSMRRDLLATLYASSRDYFGHNDGARVHSRIVQETERIDNLASTLLSTTLASLLTSVVLLCALVYLNWWLVALMAVMAPLAWACTMIANRHVRRKVSRFQSAFENFSQGVHFVIRQIDLTRTRGFEDNELEHQTDGLRELERSGVNMAMSFAAHGQVQANVVATAGLLLLISGGVAVAHGAMTMGDLLAFYVGAAFLNASVTRASGGVPDLIAGDQSLGKLHELRRGAPTLPYKGRGAIDFRGHIALRNVSHGYPDKLLLDDVSFDLDPGANVLILGPNGAGKTTIINLILGFDRPDHGELLADGRPFDAIDLRALRRAIGVVPQRPTFFRGTVAENIGYGWPDLSRGDLALASRRAGAEAFIEALPRGYDTPIGEGGALLSGGEAQRLAIARALAGRPKLLILDEPTNHLDAEGVARIMGELASSDEGIGLLTISHDPAVLRYAGTVLRLIDRKLILADSPLAAFREG